MQFHITEGELRAVLHEVELSAAALRGQLEDGASAGLGSVNVAEAKRLLKAMRDTELALRDGIVYALYDPRTGAVRYVGETMNPMRERLAGHRSKRGRPVGQWWAQLREQGLEPFWDTVGCVPAKFRKACEQQRIFQHIWLGCDLLNRSNAGDDAAAYLWLQEHARRSAEAEARQLHWHGDDDGYWDEKEPDYFVWHSLRRWRHLVRGAHCPECSARPGRFCTGMRQSARSLSEGRSNHLGRISARVRHEGGWETWAAHTSTAGRPRSWQYVSAS
ncbi:hypothetical protein [Streptomyces sp. NEAU-NA10]|uniref:hypothetical protein n=1 Tax=Streptomyces sp. NEAU-NA10 TaxID=3416050 RepID=UPI003CC59AE9